MNKDLGEPHDKHSSDSEHVAKLSSKEERRGK